jgi:hypothetical protein
MLIRRADKTYIPGFQYRAFPVDMVLDPAAQDKNYLGEFMSVRQSAGIRQRMIIDIAAAGNKDRLWGVVPGNGMVGNIRPYLAVYESISFKFLMFFIFHKY